MLPISKILCAAVPLIGVFFQAEAHEIHIVHCLEGCPTGAIPTNDLVVREIYALSSNANTKFADWVAYRVTSETIGTSSSLNRSWKSDSMLDADDTLEAADYKDARAVLDTDRGHQAPLAAFSGTVFWRTTNILSNITPQKKDLNAGSWMKLEGAVRDAAYARKEVYVVTGPVYDSAENQMSLPESDETHSVPTGYWKVVSSKSGSITAFFFDQDAPRDDDYCDHISTLAEVENMTGLDLFPNAANFPNGNLNEALGCAAPE